MSRPSVLLRVRGRLRRISWGLAEVTLAVTRSMLVLLGLWFLVVSVLAIKGIFAGLAGLGTVNFFVSLGEQLGTSLAGTGREVAGILSFWGYLGMVLGGVGKALIFGYLSQMLLRLGLTTFLLPGGDWNPGGLRLEEGRIEPLTLSGRPGLAAQVTLDPREIQLRGRLELTARLVGPEGEYLPATLQAFRGSAGELQVRRPWVRELAEEEETLELGLFLPLLALDRKHLKGPLRGKVEVLASTSGVFRSRLEIPFQLELDHPALEGLLDPSRAPALAPSVVHLLPAKTPVQDGVCSVCGDSLRVSEEGAEGLVSCDGCGTSLHQECWDFVGRCGTFACQGRPHPGPPPAEPEEGTLTTKHSSEATLEPRAEVHRVTEFPRLASFPLEVGSFPVTRVPRGPRSLLELRPLALMRAGGVMFSPLLVYLMVWVLGGNLILGLLVMVSLALGLLLPGAIPTVSRLALARAGQILARSFPQEGARDFSHHLCLLQVEALPVVAPEGGGLEIRGKFLVQGLRGHRLDLTTRVRLLGGGYLRASGPEGRGIYGELRCRILTAPLESPRARAHGFEIRIPDSLAERSGPAGLSQVAVELLIACEGELLSEADLPSRWVTPEGHPGKGSECMGWTKPASPGASGCALCGDEVLQQRALCSRCGQKSHLVCWDFTGICPGCGSPQRI